MLANLFIADSGGTGHALIIKFNEVPQSADFATEFKKFTTANCSKCTTDFVDATLAQLASGAVGATAVSAVQANTAVNYVFSPVSSAVNGLRAALGTIGRNDVKIAGYTGGYQNYVNIAAGTESAWVNEAKGAAGYNFLDTGLHGMAGKKRSKDGHLSPALPRDQGQSRGLWAVQRQRRPRMTLRCRATTSTCTPRCGRASRPPRRSSSAISFDRLAVLRVRNDSCARSTPPSRGCVAMELSGDGVTVARVTAECLGLSEERFMAVEQSFS